jgi:hypothetical protein
MTTTHSDVIVGGAPAVFRGGSSGKSTEAAFWRSSGHGELQTKVEASSWASSASSRGDGKVRMENSGAASCDNMVHPCVLKVGDSKGSMLVELMEGTINVRDVPVR